LLKEKVDPYMLVGTVIIIGSVALVNTSKLKQHETVADEMPAASEIR
jgi:drug/metabolite transporter (DMT)-like permease